MVGLAAVVTMSQSARAATMRNALLNDLRGFDIGCQTEDAAEGEALCLAIKRSLEQRFAKPVTINQPEDLPTAPSNLPVPNRVWILFRATSEGTVTRLDATWGSSMRMMGVADQNAAEPVRVPATTPVGAKADAILGNTPFRLN